MLVLSKKLEKDMNIQEPFLNQNPKDIDMNRKVFWGLQGSQNYGLSTEKSDVDTKLLVMPSFEDLALNNQPLSTTRVMEDNSHLDIKDARLYLDTLKKQNVNFIELLFTGYYVTNDLYAKSWNKLINKREDIARYSRKRTMMAMCGIAHNKANMFLRGSSEGFDEKLGYDPKQLYQLGRVVEFIERYDKDEESYAEMLRSRHREELLSWKRGDLPVEKALESVKQLSAITNAYFDKYSKMATDFNPAVDELFDEVKLEIMETYLRKVLK